MATVLAQDELFQRIKELLPPDTPMVDAISEVLYISVDSAYRRIRGETPLVLDEAFQLCKHFGLSLDHLMSLEKNSVVFRNTRIDNKNYSYEKYLTDLTNRMQNMASFPDKEIIYLTKDVPLFHNFYFTPLIAFRYFFWMKSILQHPDFSNKGVDLTRVPPAIVTLSQELVKTYTRIPSTEIWNTECVNSAISQIEFYKDSGLFSSSADIKSVYDAFEETIRHLQDQAENGCKFMPGENYQDQKPNFKFFYNRVILGDNTILVKVGDLRSVYLNYDVLNYIITTDEDFCRLCQDDLQNLTRKATLISQTGAKQRNIFFNILLSKIQDRKRNL